MPPPKKPRCRDAPWFFLAREGLSARPEWARNRRWTMPRNVSVRGAFQLTLSVGRATTVPSSETTSVEDFNPRPPRGGRLLATSFDLLYLQFQSTPSVGRATHVKLVDHDPGIISIHALRGESDMAVRAGCYCSTYFNPRPPRGGRPRYGMAADWRMVFQSTPSARRATRLSNRCRMRQPAFQSTPSARRATALPPGVLAPPFEFQSTPSARRATRT